MEGVPYLAISSIISLTYLLGTLSPSMSTAIFESLFIIFFCFWMVFLFPELPPFFTFCCGDVIVLICVFWLISAYRFYFIAIFIKNMVFYQFIFLIFRFSFKTIVWKALYKLTVLHSS